MTTLLVLILALALTSGQLIRIPVASGGITVLDITVALFCFWGLLKTKLSLKRPPAWILAAIIFTAIATLSLIFTPLRLTLAEYALSFSYTIRFFLYVLFAWIVYSGAFGQFKKEADKVLLLSGVSFAILGLLQFTFYPNLDFLAVLGWDPHYFRTVSTFFDPNFAGAYLVLTLLLLSSHLGGGRDTTPGVFYLFFTTTYFALLTTYSRSSYLMFLVSGIVLSYLKKSKILFLITTVLFLILMAGFRTYTKNVAGPRNIDRTKSASFRLNTWQQGLDLFQRFPILGVGYNAYRYGISQIKLGDEQFLKSHGSSSNDSSLLFVASTTGIIGFIAYLYFLLTLFKNALRKNILLTAGLAGLIIHSLFTNSLFYPLFLFWILVISVNPKE